jgi:hypothetical protein
MKLRGLLPLGGALILAVSPWLGCTDVRHITDPEPGFETLTVAYGDPGQDPNPCNDTLPIIDGVATEQEWSLAEPLFVRMTGRNGSGGTDYFLEVRAVWTDESKTGGGGEDRIYFLVRYPDPELNALPDQLAYIRPLEPDEFCRNTIEVEGNLYCPSPTPEGSGLVPDSVIVQSSSWTRLNRDGREDQVLLALTEVAGEAAESGLIDLNRSLLGVIGVPDVPAGWSAPDGVSNVDVWVWRAGRTNLHPIFQFAEWDFAYDLDTKLPRQAYSTFEFKSGFAEDLWVNGFGQLVSDAGPKPFVKNFSRMESGALVPNVPERKAQCPPTGRDPTEEELSQLNGGIAKELGLWWPASEAFKAVDSLACTRQVSRPPEWSVGLLPGEYDWVPGWGMQNPATEGGPTSARSVRAKGTHEAKQEKGFGVRAVEFMRELDTGQADDIVITASPDPETQEFRIVIGVFNDSGRIASGSSEIRLRFEAPKPKIVGSFNRC